MTPECHGSGSVEEGEAVALPSEGGALEALVEGHREFLGFLERRVGDRALAEDLLQEAFARSLTRIGEIRRTESAVAWFYRVLRNAVIDHHRKQATARRALEGLVAEFEAQGEDPSEATAEELCRCVGPLARSLKPEYAEALARIEVDGVPVGEYADEAGISRSNAAVRVFRARQALRRQVEVACGTCATHGCIDCCCR